MDEVDFKRALGAVAARRRLASIRGGVSVITAVIFSLLVPLHLLHILAPGWRPLPLVSFIIFWAGLAWAAQHLARTHGIMGRRGLAAELDGGLGLAGLIGAALEFDQGGRRLSVYSDFLRGETVRRAALELRGMDPMTTFGSLGRPGWSLAGLAAGTILLVQIAVTGDSGGELLGAISDPAIYFSRGGGSNLIVTSGDMGVLAGGDVRCDAVNFGEPGGSVDLRISSVPGVWKRIELLPETVMIDGFEASTYRHRFENVQESFRYRFESIDGTTAEHEVAVIHRPIVNGISAVISFPSYTETAPETIGTLAGSIYATAGSRIELIGETSKRVARGWIDFGRAEDMPLDPVPGGFRGSFIITGDDSFAVSIIDTAGLGNEEAIRYPIVVLADMAPAIEIISPRDGDYLPLSLEVVLEYEAADDFGLSAIRLHYLREGKDDRFRTRELPIPGEGPVRDIETRFDWSLSDLSLFPGDVLLYHLEAADNNTVTGPVVSRTESRRLVLPSLGELYERISERETARREGLDRIQEESKDIRRDLDRLLAEYKARGTFDWSRRREAEALMERHEEMMERIRGAGDQLGETLAELERNRATSQEIGEKLAEIRDLLSHLESEQLREAIERFRARLEEVAPDELLSAMRELDMNMEDLARRLEQTAELLRRIMRDERLEELIRRVESMLAEQREIRDSAGENEELAARQEELFGRMEELDRDLEDFEDDTGGPSPGWEEMLEDLDMEELAGRMRDAMEDLLRNDRSSAMRSQNEAMNGMLALYTSLARLQFGMGMQMNEEAARRISSAARQLIEISKLQERVREILLESGEPEEEAERQLLIREAIRSVRDQLYETARETMAISFAVFMHIGRALSETEWIIESLERRNGGVAAGGAARAYESLNLAAVELLRISTALGSGDGEGTQGKMQSLTQGQCSIDNAMRDMLDGGAGAWSIAERARMARLAAEQRRLEELLEEIGREATDTHRQLGRLDDLGEEMLEVVKRLEEGTLDEDLLEREERILSRMLESQRSLARRDYEEKRTSRTAGDLRASVPERAAGGSDETRMILEMIRNGMRERGPVEYEQLIRQYFRALARKVRSEE